MLDRQKGWRAGEVEGTFEGDAGEVELISEAVEMLSALQEC